MKMIGCDDELGAEVGREWLWGAGANWRIDNVKQRYHQCMNIECSATFRTLESIDGVIRSPATEPVIPAPAPAATVNRAGA